MSIEELIIFGKQYLHKSEVELIVAFYLDKNPLELLLYLDNIIEPETASKIKDAIERRSKNEPLSYILGEVNFCGYPFHVDSRALIPRFETEELVMETVSFIKKYMQDGIRIIDLGCGSGVIGITLHKLLPNSNVTLVDISEDALSLARENASLLDENVTILQSDMLDNVQGLFDVIVSNPPYVKLDDEVALDVLEYEPHLALFAEEDGLYFYRRILEKVPFVTNEHYLLAFEIGPDLKEDIIGLIESKLQDVTIISRDDMSGRNRMIFVMHNLE